MKDKVSISYNVLLRNSRFSLKPTSCKERWVRDRPGLDIGLTGHLPGGPRPLGCIFLEEWPLDDWAAQREVSGDCDRDRANTDCSVHSPPDIRAFLKQSRRQHTHRCRRRLE